MFKTRDDIRRPKRNKLLLLSYLKKNGDSKIHEGLCKVYNALPSIINRHRSHCQIGFLKKDISNREFRWMIILMKLLILFMKDIVLHNYKNCVTQKIFFFDSLYSYKCEINPIDQVYYSVYVVNRNTKEYTNACKSVLQGRNEFM